MSNLLLPYAYDCNNNLVHINNAQKGEKYVCPNCGAEVILKKSRIPEGQKYHRKDHFAHKSNSDNHCSESFLHKLFKDKCVDFIKDKIANGDELRFEWLCDQCNEKHEGNLLKKASDAVSEHDLVICRPDIALLDENNNVILVIEIIVNHPPEVETLQYYNKNNIEIMTLPTMPQFRTIRRIVGETDFNAIDNQAFEDSIGCCGDFRMNRLGQKYQIPYSSLYNKNFKNILAAGRIISAPQGDGWEVARVIPECALTGEAAGNAASLAIMNKCGINEINIKDLQKMQENNNIKIKFN